MRATSATSAPWVRDSTGVVMTSATVSTRRGRAWATIWPWSLGSAAIRFRIKSVFGDNADQISLIICDRQSGETLFFQQDGRISHRSGCLNRDRRRRHDLSRSHCGAPFLRPVLQRQRFLGPGQRVYDDARGAVVANPPRGRAPGQEPHCPVGGNEGPEWHTPTMHGCELVTAGCSPLAGVFTAIEGVTGQCAAPPTGQDISDAATR